MKRRKTRKVYSYQINLIPEKEGGYTVLVPLLPGCVSYGPTIEEATENAKEAISLHLEALAAHKQPIPNTKQSLLPGTRFLKCLSHLKEAINWPASSPKKTLTIS